MKYFVVFFAVVLCISSVVASKFPKCKKSDPQLNKCLINGVETIRPLLKVGIPEAQIPAIDPFVLTPFQINRKDSNLQYSGTIQGIGYGGANFQINELTVNMKDKYELGLALTIPSLDITADYNTIQLHILALNFQGKGKFSGKFTDVKAFVKVNAKPTVKNGLEYLKLVDLSVKVKIGNGNISLKDEKYYALAWSVAAFFNASPSTYLNILTPAIDDAVTDVVRDVLEKSLDKVPISEIIVDN